MAPTTGEKVGQLQGIVAYRNEDSVAENSVETSARFGRKTKL